ncbi:MAG: hypothetical protein SFV54_15890 [Bryobacteraceae bacterium]|nr:hypothetical protein [Bryobacteraceae bacterium]
MLISIPEEYLEMSVESPKPQRSEAQREASRRNGARSKGPVTPEGKARSAQNGNNHPAPIKRLEQCLFLLQHESPERFVALFEAYVRVFRPVDPFQLNLVRRICRSEWLIEQGYVLRARAVDAQNERQRDEVQTAFLNPSPDLQAALAVVAEAGRPGLPYIDRFIAQETRIHKTVTEQLYSAQKRHNEDRLPPEAYLYDPYPPADPLAAFNVPNPPFPATAPLEKSGQTNPTDTLSTTKETNSSEAAASVEPGEPEPGLRPSAPSGENA